MALTCTIGGVSFPIIENNGSPEPGYTSGGTSNSTAGSSGIAGGSDSGYQQTNNAQERQRWQCDIMDYSGTAHFQPGESVVITDPVLGILFQGYVNSDKILPIYPSGILRHSLDCIGLEYLPGKRTYTATYSTSQLAGKIAVDMLNNVLLPEGITQNWAEHEDSTAAEFNIGILAGTQGVTDANGNQWLELAQAGSNVTITENTTALFSTGTLTNIAASNNELVPTTVSGLLLAVTLPTVQTGAFCEMIFWTGSQVLATNDTLNYDIWIASTSPQIMGTVFFYFSDNTQSTGFIDQNGVPNQSATDLSNYAKDQWYSRTCSTSAYNGKTVVKAVVKFAGTSQGTYTLYIKNAYIGSHSGSPLFGTAFTTPVVNPIQISSFLWYYPASAIAALQQVMNPGATSRISPAYSISSVSLLSSSTIVWGSTTPNSSACNIFVSYDGGSSYVQCTNNAALPALPAGSVVTGQSITLKETFSVGTNPTSLPTLSSVVINLYSAPNPTSAKSDIITDYITQTQFNTGTYTNLTSPVGGGLALGTLSRTWGDNLITNQTFFAPDGSETQTASSSAYNMTITVLGSTSTGFANSRLDFCGSQILNFTLEIDMKQGNINGDVGVTFRNSSASWQASTNNTFAYAVTFAGSTMTLYAGSNGSTDTINTLATASHSMSSGTFYHLKVVANGNNFQCFWNNEGTPSINFTDTSINYQQPGGIGLRFFNHTSGSATMSWKNLLFTPAPQGTWISPSVSLSSLGTCGLSAIYWTQQNMQSNTVAYVNVSTSIDGGSTYQMCTNGGAIPNLPSGTNVSSTSIKTQVFISTIDTSSILPSVLGLVWRVLGVYPGSSGTRSTVPLGNDMSITRTVGSGWGTSFDNQTWTQTGTGTTAVAAGEETITNTTGDVHMHLGSRTWTDEDGTVRFQLSASTISAGIELRYTDANNFYRLQVSTTTVSIIKKLAGVTTTLATVSMAIPINTNYRMRFRVVGSGPVALSGNVWVDQTLEPTINATTGQWDNSLWVITAID